MTLNGGPTRLFVLLVLVAVPPLAALAGVMAFAPAAVDRAGVWPVAGAIGFLAAAWAGIVTVGFGERLGLPTQSVLELAAGNSVVETELQAEALAPVSQALARRNRQIALLAHRARAGLKAADVREAVHHVAESARLVTGDPTWVVAVLASRIEPVPAGVYGPDSPAAPEPVEDVHRWASLAGADGQVGARHVEGPWGAFLVIPLTSGPDLTANLLAPHEGRPAPLAAERDLLTLIGEYGAATIEHAGLLARVREQADRLEALAITQRDFLRGVTHDLQAPLTSIRALASEARAALDDDAIAADLESIGHEADRLGRMVGQLLAMSRLEAGALEPRQEVFRPESIVGRAWRALHADRPFDLRVVGVPHLASGDPDRFEQVVWALLDNAVRYSPPGSPIEVEIASVPSDGGLCTRTAVRDRGIGMSEAERASAFERFYRSDAARRLAPNGSGIGLHTADGLVRAMGGGIEIDSRPGEGTTVTVVLPAEEAHAADVA